MPLDYRVIWWLTSLHPGSFLWWDAQGRGCLVRAF